mgnify:CR=1 FL=1
MSVPKLRFKEFDGDWVFKKIGDISECIVPGRNKPKLFDGDIPWVTTPDLKDKTYVSDTRSNYYISEEEAKTVGSKIVPANSVIMSCVGDLGLFAINTKPIVINQQLHAFILDDHKYSSIFILNALSKNQDYIEKVATKTALPYLNKDNCNSIPLFLCSFKEQTKIASFLSAVDEKITQLTQKHQLLSQYKQGMMQKLFSQQIRFKADDGSEYGEWDFIELGEALSYEQPTKYIVSSTEYLDTYPTPVLTAGKSFILGYTNEQTGIFDASNNNVIIFDDFTTAYKFVNFRFKVKSSAMKILKTNPAQNNIYYLYSTFSTLNFPIGEEHKRRWISEYSKQEIPLPCLAEQTKIANFLSAIDQKIEVTSQQIEQAKQWKKGLLQQMFV